MSKAEELDPRWIRLRDSSKSCLICGGFHNDHCEVYYDAPDVWRGDGKPRPNSEVHSGPSVLTEDFCIIERRDFLVRSLLPIPIGKGWNGGKPSYDPKCCYAFCVWGSLSQRNFDDYLSVFDEDHRPAMGPFFSFLMNSIPSFSDERDLLRPIKCNLHFESNRFRPFLEVRPCDHEIFEAQQKGITVDRLLDMFDARGIDIREKLTGLS